MKQENKDLLLHLLQQYKELGIADQIDYKKFYLDSVVASSVALSDLYSVEDVIVEECTREPSVAEKLVDILNFVAYKDDFTTEIIVAHFGFPTNTAKCYLRQLIELGYIEAHGGKRNLTYLNRRKE